MSRRLKVLAREWAGCTRCKLGEQRASSTIVFGAGNPKAKFLVLYDAPTEQDAILGAPMSGREGELLLQLLAEAKLDASEVYCAPLVACRPTIVLTAEDQAAQTVDRDPDKEEVAACSERVREIIYRVDPLVIFTMGDLTWKATVKAKDRGTNSNLDKAVGQLFVTCIPGRLAPAVTYDVIPLMSIKQIIASPSVAEHGPLCTTARHLHKGQLYANFLEKAGRRDAAAAGFDPVKNTEQRP